MQENTNNNEDKDNVTPEQLFQIDDEQNNCEDNSAESANSEDSAAASDDAEDKAADTDNNSIQNNDTYIFDDDEDDFEIQSEPDAQPTAPSEYAEEHSDVLDEEYLLRKERRREFLKKAKLTLLIILLAIIFAFAAVYTYAFFTISDDKVMNNVYIENLDVSGLSYDETVAAINATYLFENSEITLICNEQSFPIKGGDIGLTALPEETAEKALNYCKSDNPIINGFNALKLIFTKHVIVPAPQTDTERLDEKISEFGNIVLGERIQHYVEFGDDGMVTVYSGKTGYNGDPSAAREEILTALENEQFENINVTYTSAPPDELTLEAFDALVYKEAVNAQYEINGNEVNIIPGDTGRYIDKDEAAPLLQNVYEGCEPVKIPFYVSQPEVTSETLRAKLFETTLASYSTSYAGSTSNRCANVARAASLINGTVVAPGATFSFNDTVGHRTTQNGFYTAKEYIDGKTVDGIGGGTCQVSSTLYSAVLYADMTIVERLNHMMPVGYIPLGQDATVSDGGVDFKFKNSSDYPVKVSAYTSGTTITVSIIGTAWSPAREVKISNSSSQVGENTVVRSVRYVYSNGELISTDTLNSSTYMPHKTEEDD